VNPVLIISVGLALLAAYLLVCRLLAFPRNMAVDLGNRVLAWLSAWLRLRLAWRRFTAAHNAEFAGSQFQWPAGGDEGRTDGVQW